MRELEDAAFLVQQTMAALAEAIDAFVIEGGEAGFAMKQVATGGLEGARCAG